MPKAVKKKKPVAPVAPEPPKMEMPLGIAAPTSHDGLPIIHPKLKIVEYSTTSELGPLTIADMKEMMGWETEKEFQARQVAEKGGKPENYTYGDEYHCRDSDGNKVRCRYNAHNRPFDFNWCESLMNGEILPGLWAGPAMIPGETVNGETIRISRYGRVLSGQHCITAAIMANEWLQKLRKQDLQLADEKYPAWSKYQEVFLETIVVVGLSEDPRVLMTIDYVKPRTASDVFYTSDLFKSSLSPVRKELCRILAGAVDTLWNRTAAQGYKTHPEVVGFLERHQRLLKCVEHLYSENSAEAGRKIAKLRLQPGTCAALMYLMASSGTGDAESDEYRNMMPPTEKALDWTYWDRAGEFWTLLAGGIEFDPVRDALGRLKESSADSQDNQGLGGRSEEKLMILAKAWEQFRDHPASAGSAFSEDDLEEDGIFSLSYTNTDEEGNLLPNGQVKLVGAADFYGIDCPKKGKMLGTGNRRNNPVDPPAPSREEIERLMKEARERRQQAQQAVK